MGSVVYSQGVGGKGLLLGGTSREGGRQGKDCN